MRKNIFYALIWSENQKIKPDGDPMIKSSQKIHRLKIFTPMTSLIPSAKIDQKECECSDIPEYRDG